MSNRVERLRSWLLGSAVFLALVLAAFIGSAHYLRGHFLAGLPARLGVNIVRETDGWTYCPSDKARTEYCIHAAKAVEHTDGKIALHDVWIVLYGKKGERNDRIYGDEFEYDKDAQVVRATGVVHLDLQAAQAGVQTGSAGGQAGKGGAASGNTGPVAGKTGPPANAKVMHVTTSGLIYLQKLGVAATGQPIEFESAGIVGHAVGADYASDSGTLMLHSAVNLSGTSGGHALAMTAATAEFDQTSQQALLTGWTYESEGRKASGAAATLDRRQDGTLSRVRASGNVTVAARGAKLVGQHADVALTADSQPKTAVLTGGVSYATDQTLRQMRGEAAQATIDFDSEARAQPEHAVLTRGVHLTERTRATDRAAEPWSTRELTAERVEASLAQVAGNAQLRDVTATGAPKLTLVNRGNLASTLARDQGEKGTSELSADALSAHLIPSRDAKQTTELDTIAGRGHTLLSQTTEAGLAQTVAADTLDAKLRPRTARQQAGVKARGKTAGAQAGDRLAESLASAVEQGHVSIMSKTPAKIVPGSAGKAPAIDEVRQEFADRAVYDGDLDRMTLTDGVQPGGVRVLEAGRTLWANQVVLDRKTGDSSATGGVKVNYTGDAAGVGTGGRANRRAISVSAEPTHVLADRAELVNATNVTTFYGSPVRLWQGANQLQAPVVEFSKQQQRLVARGDGSAAGKKAWPVETVLARTGSGAPAAGGRAAAGSESGKTEPVAAKTGAAGAGCPSSSAAAAEGAGPGLGRQSGAVMRISSGGLTYLGDTGTGITRQADFTSGFRAETEDGTIRAGEGTVYLRPGAAESGKIAAKGGEAVPSLAGDLDRVIATGHVELDKTGLKATGERLVYTASDRTALLTGDANKPPKAVGAQGTTTGSALLFRSTCNGTGGGTVEVVASPGQHVHTDARIDDTRIDDTKLDDARTTDARTDVKPGREAKKQKGPR